MIEEQYERWTTPLRAHPQATRMLLAANKLLTCVGYVAYPLLLVLLALGAAGVWENAGAGAAALDGSGMGAPNATGMAGATGGIGADSTSAAFLVRCIVVPAVAFAAVSVFRRAYNAPRPYEALDIKPLIIKDTHGKSFPSRHAFSMFMIAVSWLAWQPIVGGVLLACGVIMGVIRVLGGVHFPRDVVAGACAAIVAGLIGYVLIPLP